MKSSIDALGATTLRFRGRKVARALWPLELEVDGVRYRGRWREKDGAKSRGVLADKRGPLMSVEALWREVSFGGVPMLEERRVYHALRALPRARLVVRYELLAPKAKERGFLVIPGLWYGDNEAWQEVVDYPKGLERAWSFRADGSPCPAVVWTSGGASYALAFDAAVSFDVVHKGMDDVLGVGFASMRSRPTAVLTFPAQEVPRSYPWGHKLGVAKKPTMTWRRGARLELTLYHSAAAASRAYHTRVFRAHKERCSPGLAYPVRKAELTKTARAFVRCLKESHFHEGRGFSHRDGVMEIFSGWCGGFAAAYAALRFGRVTKDAELWRMGETMCDFLCGQGLSEAGVFYSAYTEKGWVESAVWGKARGIHLRSPSEGCCYLALILQEERVHGRERPMWTKALRKNLDTMLARQRADGAFPHEIDGKTGKPLSWVGASSGAFIGALAVFARFAGRGARAYREAATRAASYYLRNYVEKERYIGGPYDTYMAPNMEDAYNLLLAFAELYESTADARWLGAAKAAADHLLSWRYIYDVTFPRGTICAEQAVRTVHMSPASVANKHMQNWDTLADTYLARLSRWLDDPFYAECALQHLLASTQLVQRGQLPPEIPYGGQSEQWYATDFNWFGDCGDYTKGNMWKVSVVLPKVGFLLSLMDLLPPEDLASCRKKTRAV